VLGGELAVPCHLQTAIAGSMLMLGFYCICIIILSSVDNPILLQHRFSELRQAWKGAAVNLFLCVLAVN